MPVMQTAHGQTRITGTAVLKEDRLAAILDLKETRGLVWLLGRVRGEALTVRVGERSYALRRVRAKAKTKVDWAGNRPIARAYISISAEVSAPWSELGSDTLKQVEAALGKYVQEEVKAVITLVQKSRQRPDRLRSKVTRRGPSAMAKPEVGQGVCTTSTGRFGSLTHYGMGMRN
jgi:hypothetical protein